MKLILKITIGFFITFLALVLALAAFTQTARFKTWLRDQLLAQAHEKLQGKLSLGRIEGNLVSNFALVDLQIDYANEALARVSRVEVGFRLLPLWNGRVQIDKVLIDSLALNLKQEADSLWNVQKLVLLEADTTSPSAMHVSLASLEIRHGAVRFTPLDTASFFYQRACENISLALQLEQERTRTVIDLSDLSCSLAGLPFTLSKARARLIYDADSLRVEKLSLEMGGSKLSGELSVTNLAQPKFRAHVRAAPLHLEDAQAFLPQITTTGPLQLEAEVSGDARSAAGTLALTHAAGNVHAIFAVQQDSLLAYDFSAEIRGLDAAKLLPEPGLSSRLNFNLEINGEGLALDEIAASASLTMDSSRFEHVTISHLVAEAAMGDSLILANAFFLSPNGELALIGSVRDFQQAQEFHLDLSASSLDAGAILQDSALASNVSFNFEGQGRGFDPQRLAFNGKLALAPSFIKPLTLDTLFSVFRWRDRTLWLDTLQARTDLAHLQAEGRASLAAENDLQFHAELGNLELARAALKVDTLAAHGTISGRAHGRADALRVAGAFNLQRVKYNRTKLDTLFGDFTFARRDSNSGGAVHVFARKMLAAVVPLDSLYAAIDYNLQHADIVAGFWEGLENSGDLKGRYVYGDVGRFYIQQAKVTALNRLWETPPDSMWIEVGDFDYFYHNLKVRSGRTQVFAHGKIALLGAQDFRFGVEELELASLAERLGYKEDLRGAMTLEARLGGALAQPEVSGHVLLRHGKLAEFAFEHLAGSFGFHDEQINWGFTLAQDQARVLTGEGFLPVRMAAGDTGLVVRHDRPIRMQAATEGLDLAFLQTFLPKLKRVKGGLSFDAKIENTLQDPQPNGVFNIYEGEFSVPENGTSYRDFRLGLKIQPGIFSLASKVLSEKGNLSANATINYAKDKITSAEGELKAQNFLVSRTRSLELLLDADIRAGGDVQQLSYGGDVTIERSRFFLQALQRQSALELEAPPAATATPADSTFVAVATVADPIAQLLEKIHGELKINIPRNTWIRGPEVNLEIAGELDFIQDGQKFSAFGPIRIVRGSYELFGKRFEVQQGEIIFQGNIENPPTITLEARYVYRLDKEKHQMFVKITGALNNPRIEFLEEHGAALEQREALALLLFNVPFDRLGLAGGNAAGEKMDLTKTARGLISGLVSQQLTNTLGKRLGLDVVEFQGGEQAERASVMVGRYINNDLFLSVTQDFSGSADALRVALELEITRYLFLQAAKGGKEDKESGFDLILKKEW